MRWFTDIQNRKIRLTDERKNHIENDHPEMSGQANKIFDTLLNPDVIVKSITDADVELFYQNYKVTPLTEKYLCVIVKEIKGDLFIITSYFTDSIKRGEILWKKK